MFAALVRRERRPLWGALSLILVAGIVLSMSSAASAKARLEASAERDARVIAQTTLTPMLETGDVEAPVPDARAQELTAQIQSQILSTGTVDGVTIYSSIGRILYAADLAMIGTRPSYLTDFLFEVAHTATQSQVHGDELITYTPVWLKPGGTVAIAAVSQPIGPIDDRATGSWYLIAMVLGGLFLLSTSLFAMTFRAAAAPAPSLVQVYETIQRREPRELRAHGPVGVPGGPAYVQAGFREAEEGRQAAERRAAALEENFKGLQQQFKQTLEQLKEAEGRLAVKDVETTTTGGELDTLRDQLRDTAERLHKAELDSNAMRERHALRTKELDDVKSQLERVRRNPLADDELAKRLEEAQRRAEQAEARAAEAERELERMRNELEYTNDKFHMTKLSEALRELDNDVVLDEDEDDVLDHPKVLYSKPFSAPGKVR